ncbi:helix-turn-helix domain-containing protein [Actinokineospora iranica]|uniref:Helix-turn-helix domain-containing protein n=1 Tax=Actinokineospora iranica TaxID=1271860 RepID=A0A1G6Y8T1_9PSEU|nr:helix-turn-helix transcriptional regulator [Actinokineospora iranica]SDD86137.1 Helix-turn-helix domain-containing protein [Actinokineospora iranica]
MVAPPIDTSKLRRLRITSRRTVTQLAADAGCTKGALSAIEHGRRRPSPALLGRLADALGIDPGELLLPDDSTAQAS